jgi:hypothetical protein
VEEELQVPQLQEGLLPKLGDVTAARHGLDRVHERKAIEHPTRTVGHAVVERLQRLHGVAGSLDCLASSSHSSGHRRRKATRQRWAARVREERDLRVRGEREAQAEKAPKLQRDSALVGEERGIRRRLPPSPGQEAVVLGLVDVASREAVTSIAEIGRQHPIRGNQQPIRRRVEERLRRRCRPETVQPALHPGHAARQWLAVRALDEHAHAQQ